MISLRRFCLIAAAASPTAAEDDLWADFVQSGQSEVCTLTFFKKISFLLSCAYGGYSSHPQSHDAFVQSHPQSHDAFVQSHPQNHDAFVQSHPRAMMLLSNHIPRTTMLLSNHIPRAIMLLSIATALGTSLV